MLLSSANQSQPLLSKNALSSNAFNFIQEKIIAEEYPHDFLLNEVDIAAELGISRTPVREAIKQLENDGLVKLEPNRGAFVVGLSKEDMENILLIRAFLEGLCARWAANRLTDEQRVQLQEVVDLQQFYLERGNLQQAWIAGHPFHSIIYNSCGSRQVIKLLNTYHNYIFLRIKKNLLKRDSDHPATALKEHISILNAINAKDPVLSEQLMNSHLRHTKYTL